MKIIPALLLISPLVALIIVSPAFGETKKLTQNSFNPKAVIISLDAGGEEVIEQMLNKGLMPNLSKIRHQGVHSAFAVTNFPSKTAPSHASLWTGVYGYKNGVSSNSVFKRPLSEHTVLETENGFGSSVLTAESLWVMAAKQNKKVLITQATHSYPFTPYFEGKKFGMDCSKNLTIFDGYSDLVSKDQVFNQGNAPFREPSGWKAGLPVSNREIKEINFNVAETGFSGLIFDDPKDKTDGYDTLLISKDKKNVLANLKPGLSKDIEKFSPGIIIETKNLNDGIPPRAYFRLFDLESASGKFILYQTEVRKEYLSDKDFVKKHAFEIPTFVGHPASEVYEEGLLGKTIVEDGDSKDNAENRFLETVKFSIDHFKKRALYAMKNYPDRDLVINYLPFPDSMLHTWYGGLDPSNPSYKPELAEKLMPFAEKVFPLVDDYIGVFLNNTPPDTIISVVSDHGMMGISKIFYPNTVLKNAGLLGTNDSGKIDLSKTKILYPPTDGAFLSINKSSRKGGFVTPEQYNEVLESASDALLSAKDPETGKNIVTKVFDVRELEKSMQIGGEFGGDLYLDLAYGYYFSSKVSSSITDDVAKTWFPTAASHIYFPQRKGMHAIFFIKGKQVAKNKEIPYTKTIDMVPTICKLLGIKPASSVEGHIIQEVFE